MREPTPEIFLRDVREHRMNVVLNSGVYRHLKFQRPGDSNHWFDLITWPDVLTIHGDMGTWTFSRVEDMFTFFRSSGSLSINPSYWQEKLRAGVQGYDLAKVFDADVFREQMIESLDNYGFSASRKASIKRALKDALSVGDSEWELFDAAANFSHTPGEPSGVRDPRAFHFDSCDLPSGKVYTYHFLWCLYAIVWGIQQYDNGR
jgi:hypothetical protein